MVRRGSRWMMAGVFCLLVGLSAVSWGADKALFSLDWVIQGFHAPYFVALEKGYYKRNGLDVGIQRGFGSADTLKRVGAGSSAFGFADSASLVAARSQGTQVKELAVIYDRSMFAIYSLEGSGIRKPKDLEGKTIADSGSGGVYVVFPAFAAKNGVDAGKVKWQIMAPPLILSSLLAGKADAAAFYAVSGPVVSRKAAEIGKKAVPLYYSDWGIDVYSNGLVARDALIRDNPDLAKRFVDATMRAAAWSVENPSEAVGLFSKLHPDLDKSLSRDAWAVAMDHLLTNTAKKHGIGYMTRDKMTFTRDLMTKYMKLKQVVPVEDLYTNQFLPKLFPKRGK